MARQPLALGHDLHRAGGAALRALDAAVPARRARRRPAQTRVFCHYRFAILVYMENNRMNSALKRILTEHPRPNAGRTDVNDNKIVGAPLQARARRPCLLYFKPYFTIENGY